MDATEKLSMTCNVPAGSKDRVQPSYNSKFPSDVAIPNPLDSDRMKESKLVRAKRPVPERKRLPVIDELTCQTKSKEAHPMTTTVTVNSSTSSEIHGMASDS